jgi:hypothetical protein
VSVGVAAPKRKPVALSVALHPGWAARPPLASGASLWCE